MQGVHATTDTIRPQEVPSAEPHGARRGRWAKRVQTRRCSLCDEAVPDFDPLPCCASNVCTTCLRHWASVQVLENGVSSQEVRCTSCDAMLDERLLRSLIESSIFKVASTRTAERREAASRESPSLANLA